MPARRQVIIWVNAWCLVYRPFGPRRADLLQPCRCATNVSTFTRADPLLFGDLGQLIIHTHNKESYKPLLHIPVPPCAPVIWPPSPYRHWSGDDILMIFFSLAAPKFVQMTTCGSASDENFIKWQHFRFSGGVRMRKWALKWFDHNRCVLYAVWKACLLGVRIGLVDREVFTGQICWWFADRRANTRGSGRLQRPDKRPQVWR